MPGQSVDLNSRRHGLLSLESLRVLNNYWNRASIIPFTLSRFSTFMQKEFFSFSRLFCERFQCIVVMGKMKVSGNYNSNSWHIWNPRSSTDNICSQNPLPRQRSGSLRRHQWLSVINNAENYVDISFNKNLAFTKIWRRFHFLYFRNSWMVGLSMATHCIPLT